MKVTSCVAAAVSAGLSALNSQHGRRLRNPHSRASTGACIAPHGHRVVVGVG